MFVDMLMISIVVMMLKLLLNVVKILTVMDLVLMELVFL